jgi:transposase-like protein
MGVKFLLKILKQCVQGGQGMRRTARDVKIHWKQASQVTHYFITAVKGSSRNGAAATGDNNLR